MKVTNPFLIPLRKVIPGFYGIDFAAIVLLYIVQFVELIILFGVQTGGFTPWIFLGVVFALLSLLFFLILFYFGFLMVEEAFTKNYSTGTVWDPPLWIPYSSMALGAILMILQYIAEIIKLTDDKDYN